MVPHSVICKMEVISLLTSVVIVVRNKWDYTCKALSTIPGTQEMLRWKLWPEKNYVTETESLHLQQPTPGNLSCVSGRLLRFWVEFWDVEFIGQVNDVEPSRGPLGWWADLPLLGTAHFTLRHPHSCSRHGCIPGPGTMLRGETHL